MKITFFLFNSKLNTVTKNPLITNNSKLYKKIIFNLLKTIYFMQTKIGDSTCVSINIS